MGDLQQFKSGLVWNLRPGIVFDLPLSTGHLESLEGVTNRFEVAAASLHHDEVLVWVNHRLVDICPSDIDFRRVLVQASLHWALRDNSDATIGLEIVRRQRYNLARLEAFRLAPLDASRSALGREANPSERPHLGEQISLHTNLEATKCQLQFAEGR